MANKRRFRMRCPLHRLYSETGAVVKLVREVDADRMVERGAAIRVYTHDDRFVGYQLTETTKRECKAPRSASAVVDLTSTFAVTTAEEMDVLAGQSFRGGENKAGVYGRPGRSVTMGMNDWQRDQRIANGLDPEDEVERAIARRDSFAPGAVA